MHRVFFGHHKCTSRFFRLNVVASIAKHNDWEIVTYKIKDRPYHFSDLPDLDLDNIDFDRLRRGGPAVVNILNSSPAVVATVAAASPEFRGLHVLRDPRPYFHHREGHPIEGLTGFVWDKLAEDRPVVLQALSVEEGLIYELENITKTVIEDQLISWVPDARIIEVRVEDANNDKEGFLNRLRNHFQIEVMPRIDWDVRYSDSGALDWHEHFTPRLKAIFKDRYGTALIDMGY